MVKMLRPCLGFPSTCLLLFLLLLGIQQRCLSAVDETSTSTASEEEGEEDNSNGTTEFEPLDNIFTSTQESALLEAVAEDEPEEMNVSKQQQRMASCDVFDPFKVVPAEPGHFQIGGAFPLHNTDCLELNSAAVQDVVAVQWAMAYWNENSPKVTVEEDRQRRRPKLGLFAGDSCSRPKEAISQSLRFLDSVGYHEPEKCLPAGGTDGKKRKTGEAGTKIIAMLAPSDRDSAEAVAQVVRPSAVPVGVYSPAAAQAFLDANVADFISTAPLSADFGRALVEVLKLLGADLISIVDYGDGFAPTAKLVEQLRREGISVAEHVPFDHSQLASLLTASDSQIIVSLVPNHVLADAGIGRSEKLREIRKLWISMELEAGYEPEGPARLDFWPDNVKDAKLQILTIRRQQRYLAEFNAYFLRILVTNYEHYSLLNAYVQHVYNCTQQPAKGAGKRPKADCSQQQLEPKRLAQLHRQSTSLESIVLLVYALARTAERVEKNPDLMAKCATPSSACFEGIRAELLQLAPVNSNDEGTSAPNRGRLPPGFGDQLARMEFFTTQEGVLQMAGLGLEAVLLEKEGREMGGSVYRLLDYRTGLNEKGEPVGTVEKFPLPQRIRHIRSKCPPYRPYCLDKCKLAARRRDDQTFLSIPQPFPLYLAAMFDFQGGPNCDRLRRENPADVAMPLAFVHAMSTFRQRHSPKSTLFNPLGSSTAGDGGQMDVGSLLVDTCSSGRTLTEFLMDSERSCYKFAQVERNWTIAAGATIGYVFGSEEIEPSQSAGILQALFSGPSSPPVLTLASTAGSAEHEDDTDNNNDEDKGLFSVEPSHRAMATALAKFLRRMHWTYVNVVLDRSDAASLSLHAHFERLSAGICTAQLTIVGDEQGGTASEQPLKKKRSQQGLSKGQQQNGEFPGAVAAPNANVTLLFSAAKPAAEYMSARLRDEFMGSGTGANVHVMVGAAHDFHLHDPTNLAQYAGTVSFQAKDVSSSDFHDWLRSITPLTLPEIWYWRHVEENWHCALARSNIGRFNGRMCTGEELLDVQGMGRLTKAGYLARGVDQLLVAIDRAHKKLCPNNEKLCEEFTAKGSKMIRELLAKQGRDSVDEFEVYQLIPSGHHGIFGYKLFANYSTSSSSNSATSTKGATTESQQFQFIADYRPFANGGAHLDSGNEGSNDVNNGGGNRPPIVSRCRAPFCRCMSPGAKNDFSDPMEPDDLSLARSTYIRREPASGKQNAPVDEQQMLLFYENDDPEVQQLSGLAERELADALRVLLCVLSALLCALAVATMLLILIKMWQRTIRGHQSLGLCLLCGICALYACGFLFASAPSHMICHLRMACHALAHALCFGVVIVKAIQLRNAEALALMGASAQQISYWNYWLLLTFIFAVQLVICLKWLLARPLSWLSTADQSLPDASSAPNGGFVLCSYSSPSFVLAQLYTFFLLFLALLLSVQNRNIKRNYKEAKWLFVASLSCTLLLCAWAACHVLISPVYLDLMTVLELHLTGTLLLAFVFGPKLYVLLFYEPVLVECAYGGSLDGRGGDGRGKGMDLFEAGTEWSHVDDSTTLSPTLTNRSEERSHSRLRNLGGPITEEAEEEEEKVTSAFQTVLRKKTGGSNSSSSNNSKRNGKNAIKTSADSDQQQKHLHPQNILISSTPTSHQQRNANNGKRSPAQNV